MATLGGTDLGSVQTEEQSKDSGLFQQPLPGEDSSGALLIDIFGAFRNISVTGYIIGTVAVQNVFIAAIEAIQNGNQTGSTFVSSQTGTPNRTVLIQSFSWNKEAGDVSRLNYSLTLFEGGI